MSKPAACALCGRPSDGPLPRWLINLAAGAMAFFHGGMWAVEGLSGTYCRRDRTFVTTAVTILAVSVLAGAGLGAAIWIRYLRGR